MAAVMNGTGGNNLSRTTNLPSIYSCTMMGWVFPTSFVAGGIGTCCANGASGGNFYCVGVTSSSGNKVAVYTGGGTMVGSSVLTASTWIHLAITVAGSGAGQCIGYLNGVQEISTAAVASLTATTHYVGDSAGGDPLTGRVGAVKIYNGVLTADQIKQEMRSYMPVNTTNLVSWHPLFAHTDVSQYGATYTVNGTVTTAQGPPITWSVAPTRGIRLAAPAAAVVSPPHTLYTYLQAVPRAAYM